MTKTGGVSREHDPSLAPRLVSAGLHAAVISVCVWVALGAGLPDRTRALVLLGCAALYFLRNLITLLVFLKRRVAYSEAVGLIPFLALFEVGFLLLGGGIVSGQASSLGLLDGVGLLLLLVGSGINTGSELQRWAWKKNTENEGQCYTKGLFAWSMHINYFGDIVLFTGWALLAHSLIALIIPLAIGLSFIFFHIPALDAYLADRYGEAFRVYAEKTPKLIPFVY